jgi:hypothetical protein
MFLACWLSDEQGGICMHDALKQIDYINEGRNADRFRRNFRDVPWVRVPIIHWEYCSPRVLTMEYLPGTKISAKAALQAQVFEWGVGGGGMMGDRERNDMCVLGERPCLPWPMLALLAYAVHPAARVACSLCIDIAAGLLQGTAFICILLLEDLECVTIVR